jgi:Predicted permease
MAIIASILCGIIMILFYFQELFVVVLFGLCFIVLFDKGVKIFNRYTKKYTRKQRQVIAVMLLLILGNIAGFFLSQIADISNLLSNLENLQLMIEVGMQMLMDLLSEFPENIADRINEFIAGIIESMYAYVGIVISQALFYVLTIVLLYPIMFKMYLKDKEQIKAALADLVPRRFEKEAFYTASTILTQSNNFFVAKIIESIAIAVICSVGFYIIGLPGWLFLGILAGLLNNVPYIGPIFGSVPPIVVGFALGWETAAWAIVICVIAQVVDNIYLVPFMISSKVSVNPLTTVVLILTFSQLFGALGMILSIPIYIVCKIILIESYKLLVRIFPEPITD